MALSGSLDTFALPDVLRLLSSTDKTGRLRVTGDRGSGSVWVDAGQVVATELATSVTSDPSPAEVVFGLLRFTEGSFNFEVDAAPDAPGSPQAMEPILADAEQMMVEWREIEAVIPSLDVWVGLAPSLAGADVTIDQARWSGIAAIGSGAQVGAVAEALQLNEIDSCRLVKDLLELDLVTFLDVGSPAGAEPVPTAADDLGSLDAVEADADDGADDLVPELLDGEPETDGELALDAEALLDELGDTPSLDDTSFEDGADLFVDDAPADTGTVPSLAALGDDTDPAADEDLDPAEMARQLANLSPKAAKAVAAAAKATTEAERDAALAAVEAEDDSVNRGLLLKFLGSVETS